VIELDVSREWEPAELRMPRGVARRFRWISAGLVLVALLALAAASAPPTRLTPSFTVGGRGVQDAMGSGRIIFVLQQPNQGRAVLDAYRVRDGARLWSKSVAASSRLLSADDDRVILFTTEDGRNVASLLLGIDARDGAVVWRQAGYAPVITGLGPEFDLVIADVFTAGPESQQEQQRRDRRLVGIDNHSGAVRWSIVTPAGTDHTYATLYRSGRLVGLNLVELDPDGTLRLRNLRSGQVDVAVKLANAVQFDGFDVVGDRLMAYQSRTRTASMYDLKTGQLLWTLPAEAENASISWCGSVLCQGVPRNVTVLDRDTGRALWTAVGWNLVLPLDDRHLLTSGASGASGASGGNGFGRAGGVVVDAATGRVVRRLAAWNLLDTLPWPELLVWQAVGDRRPVVGRFNAETGAVTLLGQANDWTDNPQCWVTATFLACRGPERLSVWRTMG
jgi:outer membrane protein assembly factor BamB